MTVLQLFYSSLLSNLNMAISDKKQIEHIFKTCAQETIKMILGSKSLMP